MKILNVVIANPLRKINGATIAALELSRATSELVSVDAAVMWDATTSERQGQLQIHYRESRLRIPLIDRIAPRWIKIPLYDSDIPQLIVRGNYSVVHIHNLVPAYAARRVALAAKQQQVPYVVSTHGLHELVNYAELQRFGPIKTLLSRLALEGPARRVIRNADGIFLLSDRDAELISDEIGADPLLVALVPNGASEYFFEESTEAEKTAVAVKFGLTSTRPIVFYMGSLYSYKGADTFLRAAEMLEEPAVAVLGGGFRDSAQKRRLLAEAELDEAAASRIIFTGELRRAELRALYQLASVFAYPTRGDTLPLVVLEAMACGAPIVSTNVGGIPFAVSADEGTLVQPGDASAVARAVDALLRDEALRRRMSLSAQRRAASQFRWSVVAEAAVSGYEALLARAHGRTGA